MCEFYSYNNNQNLKSTQCNITIVCKKIEFEKILAKAMWYLE